MKKIGFIGLGIMGKPMVKNLLKAGFEVTAYDILPAAVQEMAEAGAIAGTSPKQAAQGKDVVITMVPSGPIVRSLLEGEDGVLAGIPEGAVIVDMSSVTAIESQFSFDPSRREGTGNFCRFTRKEYPYSYLGQSITLSGRCFAEYGDSYGSFLRQDAKGKRRLQEISTRKFSEALSRCSPWNWYPARN